MKYEVVMGLEVHVEMATESKLFCSCSAKFGADANENVCPACAGMPGFLPVTNKKAVELGMKAGFVTNCDITRCTTFDKKNYFYPDLSTGYQITQLNAPICRNGYVEIETPQGAKKIRIKQIHIEEDAGKLVHDGRNSLVDYNRASVPLVEIVSQPDFRSVEEVIAYLEKLRSLLVFAGVSDCKMEEGSMRADINISVREQGSEILGTRTEMKNMNSLKAISRAIAYESERHIDALETGCEELVQETRRWDDSKNMSFSMRNKENATDYRYFPNPDLMPIYIDDEWYNGVKASVPEMPHEKYARYTAELALSEYDAKMLSGSKVLSDIFDETMKHCDKARAKDAAVWLTVELMNLVNNDSKPLDECKLNSEKLAKLIGLVDSKVVNRNTAKEIFGEIYRNDVDPEKYVEEHGLAMVSDDSGIRRIIVELIGENQKSVDEYKNGNKKVIGFFVGKVMKEMKGKADPQAINSILTEELDKQ